MSSSVSPPLQPTLPPRFEVRKELGRGGMGVVYHAFDQIGERDVAVKFLPPTDDESLVRRFRREAGDLAAIVHPNVVDFYSLGEFEGQDFIEMEFVDGGDLRSWVRDSTSLGTVLELYAQTCDGLAHIHELGMVHRDIKPANVLVTSDGVPKISDLGLVRRLEERSQLTQDGTVLGTSSFLAPEQLLSHAVGPEADLYALGVCLFEAVTGDRLFNAPAPLAMIRAHVEQKPRTPSRVRPGLPEALDALILSLLEKKAPNRPSAGDTAKKLRAILAELTPEQDLLCATSADALLARAKMYLQDGYVEESLELLADAEEKSQDQDLLSDIRLTQARVHLIRRPKKALTLAKEVVEDCRNDGRKELGQALVVLARGAISLQDWELARSSLQEARGLISSSQIDLQKELMESLASLHELGSEAGHAGLSLEEAKGFRQIASGLSKRTQSQTGSRETNSAPTPQETLRVVLPTAFDPQARKLLKIPLGLVLLILLGAGIWYGTRPTTASLVVTSQPPGAVVLVDKERYMAPYQNQKIEPGAYRVKVYLQGYKPHLQMANLKAGESLSISAKLEPASGGLSFASTPSKAKVFVNDQEKGVTPLTLSGLPLKEFKVKLVKKGYKPHQEKVLVQAGTTRELKFELKKKPPPPPPRPRYNPRRGGGRNYNRGRPPADVDVSIPLTPIRIRMNTPW